MSQVQVQVQGQPTPRSRTCGFKVTPVPICGQKVKPQGKEMSSAIVAATSLQRIVRGYLARKRFMKIKKGFIKLQAVFRGVIMRRKLKRMQKSASVIQKRYRGYKQVQRTQSEFINLKKATGVIQREWRRWKFRQGIE